jgi:hypothetical protein
LQLPDGQNPGVGKRPGFCLSAVQLFGGPEGTITVRGVQNAAASLDVIVEEIPIGPYTDVKNALSFATVQVMRFSNVFDPNDEHPLRASIATTSKDNVFMTIPFSSHFQQYQHAPTT